MGIYWVKKYLLARRYLPRPHGPDDHVLSRSISHFPGIQSKWQQDYLFRGKDEGGSGVEAVLVEQRSFEVWTVGPHLLVLELFPPAHDGAGSKVGFPFLLNHFEGEMVMLTLA